MTRGAIPSNKIADGDAEVDHTRNLVWFVALDSHRELAAERPSTTCIQRDEFDRAQIPANKDSTLVMLTEDT